MTATIRGVLFDKDGTLIDVIGTWLPVYREMLQESFPGRQDLCDRVLEQSGYDAEAGTFRANSPLASGTTDNLVDLWWPGLDLEDRKLRIRRVDEEFRTRSIRHLRTILPLEPLFADLRARNLKVGIATNDAEASARAHVATLNIGQFVEFVAGYDSVRRPKPAGDMVHAFCRACGLEPREVAVVGDNPHDLDMGRNAGAGLVIAVLTGNGGRDDFAGLANAVLESIADLPAYLDGA
jgi:phosphoglycolate phosphatase